MTDSSQQIEEPAEDHPEVPEKPSVTLPDFLLEPNVVLLDDVRWRHGQVTELPLTKSCSSF